MIKQKIIIFIWTNNVSRLAVTGFKWILKTLKIFDGDFVKKYMVIIVTKENFLNLRLQILSRRLHNISRNYTVICLFSIKNRICKI